MTNLSSKTRKQLVLDLLEAAHGTPREGWVNTADINSPTVGGTEGTRRLRELKADGYLIEKRKHPDPDVSQFQYRLAGHYTPPQPKLTGRIVSGTSDRGDDPERDRDAHTLPWVTWRPGRAGSMTARHRDTDLWVSPALNNQWVWRASSQTIGLIGTGFASTMTDAKRAAVAIVEAADA